MLPTPDFSFLLSALERSLEEPGSISEALRQARPDDLHIAFAYELTLLVRGGAKEPSRPPTPAGLLALAQRAADAGVVSWSTPVALRKQLRQLAADLQAAELWDPAKPLWWQPLPVPTAAEGLWAALDAGMDNATSGSEKPEASGWITFRQLVPTDILADAADEVERAYREGSLQLERGGVGKSGERAPQRSDEVAFFSGLEHEILRAAPRLAVLVQWLLARFPSEAEKAFPHRQVQSPQKAMLARYPAPSVGYRPHLDNPGGAEDNGRALTCVVYLNPPGRECAGGEIALWPAGSEVSASPGALHPPRGGSAVLFDSRAVPHQVLPLREGPARWALTLWFQDAANLPSAPRRSLPAITAMEALQAIADPQLSPGVLLFHALADETAGGHIAVRRKSSGRPRVGLVATVYRGGELLERWCEHHLGLEFDHVVLVFDHLEEPAERADAARLRARYPAAKLTLWSGAEVKAARWPELPPFREREQLRAWAAAGAASFAVASRQALNASAALAAARTDELGGAPLDWLLHLDADEWFLLEGDSRGGADLHQHFAAASDAGHALLRYLNHELLLPWDTGRPPRFKLNPSLAASRLGPGGWQSLVSFLRMAQTDPRPYFTGYYNGKSAVAVQRGLAAAGVHGWHLAAPRDPHDAPEGSAVTLAGPSILHLHRPSPREFAAKYRGIAAADWAGARPFPPCPAEEAAVGLLRSLGDTDAADPATIERELAALYHRLTAFTEAELDLLQEAGLIVTPTVATLSPVM